jgi:hypothetical protein
MGSSRLYEIVAVSCSMGLFKDLHVFYDDFYFRKMKANNKNKQKERKNAIFVKVNGETKE